MSLPSEMNFVDVPAPGGPENMVLKKGPLPEVKPGDILRSEPEQTGRQAPGAGGKRPASQANI